MKINIADDYKALSRLSAQILAQWIQNKRCSVIGFATGSTPIGMYRELIRLHKEEGLDFSQATSFNLDEYVGLSADNPQSYHFFMQNHLFKHINIPGSGIHLPCGNAADLQKECRRYEQAIAEAGGIDIQILGIGSNGHIGFNEPGADPQGRTQIVRLTDSTIHANARFFPSISEVPARAISMGVRSILDSKRIILLANGKGKAEAIRRLVEGDVSRDFPASYLKEHPDVLVLLDREAAQYIMKSDLRKYEHVENFPIV